MRGVSLFSLSFHQGNLTRASFRVLMLKKFRQFVQRKLADAVRLLDNSTEVRANLLAQKYLLITAMHDHDALVQESLDEFRRAGKWGQNTAEEDAKKAPIANGDEGHDLRDFVHNHVHDWNVKDPPAPAVASLMFPAEMPTKNAIPAEEGKAGDEGNGHGEKCGEGNRAFSEGVVGTLKGLRGMLSAQPSSELTKFVPEIDRLVRDMTATLGELPPQRAPASVGTMRTADSIDSGEGDGVGKADEGFPGPVKGDHKVLPAAPPAQGLEASQAAGPVSGSRLEALPALIFDGPGHDFEERLSSLEMTSGKERDAFFRRDLASSHQQHGRHTSNMGFA